GAGGAPELVCLRDLCRLRCDERVQAPERGGQVAACLPPLREVEGRAVAAVDVAEQARLELVDDALQLECRRRDVLRMRLRVRRIAQGGGGEERQRESRSPKDGQDSTSDQPAAPG